MNTQKQPKTLKLTDPRSLRALAHPLRLELMALLRSHGPLTATTAAALTGESAGSCSFHFRQLAKWGLIEEAPHGSGRQRPWRATADVTTWSTLPTSDGQDAAQQLNRVLAERYLAGLLQWYGRTASEPAEWVAAAATADVRFRLTVEEFARLNEDLRAVLLRWAQETADRPARDDTRLVQFVGWTHPVASAVEPPQ